MALQLEEKSRCSIDAAWSTLMDGDVGRCLTIAEFTEVLYAVLDFFTRWKETYSPGFKAFMTESERGVRAAVLADKRVKERRASTAAAAAAAAPAIEEVEVSSAILCYCAAQAPPAGAPRPPDADELPRPPLEDDLSGTQAFKIGALFKRRLCRHFPDAAAPLPCDDENAGDNGVPRGGGVCGCPDRLNVRGSLDAGHVHAGGPRMHRDGSGTGAHLGAQLLWGGDLDALVEQRIETEAGLHAHTHAHTAADLHPVKCPSSKRRVSFGASSICSRTCSMPAKSPGADTHGPVRQSASMLRHGSAPSPRQAQFSYGPAAAHSEGAPVA
ncbi:hypothetical protein FOA52_002684 [Chlamydomonas sp. UWO 241]|nr:hypothetical protein FOA52_002684 [Chlamydomonas sp. UWO 241]